MLLWRRNENSEDEELLVIVSFLFLEVDIREVETAAGGTIDDDCLRSLLAAADRRFDNLKQHLFIKRLVVVAQHNEGKDTNTTATITINFVCHRVQ